MVECPECGYEFDPDDDLEMMQMALDPSEDPTDVEDASTAILKYYKPDFNLGDRLALEETIKECLTAKLGVSAGLL